MMPRPAVTVGDLIESLSVLPQDAPIALTDVVQEWDAFGSPPKTTLTLVVWGDLSSLSTPRRIDTGHRLEWSQSGERKRLR